MCCDKLETSCKWRSYLTKNSATDCLCYKAPTTKKVTNVIIFVNTVTEFCPYFPELVSRNLLRQQGFGYSGLCRRHDEGRRPLQPPHRPQLRLRLGGTGNSKIQIGGEKVSTGASWSLQYSGHHVSTGQKFVVFEDTANRWQRYEFGLNIANY